MTFYAQVRKADSLVVSVTTLTAQQAAKFPSDADTSLVEITEAEHATAQQGTTHEGSIIPKWSWNGTKFVNNADTRPVVTFTPTEIKAEVDEVVSVGIAFSNSITGLREFTLAGVPMRIDFLNGAATVQIDTSRPGVFTVRSERNYKVAVPLQVTVFARKIGPPV